MIRSNLFNDKNAKNTNKDAYIKTINIRSIYTSNTYASGSIDIRNTFFTWSAYLYYQVVNNALAIFLKLEIMKAI